MDGGRGARLLLAVGGVRVEPRVEGRKVDRRTIDRPLAEARTKGSLHERFVLRWDAQSYLPRTGEQLVDGDKAVLVLVPRAEEVVRPLQPVVQPLSDPRSQRRQQPLGTRHLEANKRSVAAAAAAASCCCCVCRHAATARPTGRRGSAARR